MSCPCWAHGGFWATQLVRWCLWRPWAHAAKGGCWSCWPKKEGRKWTSEGGHLFNTVHLLLIDWTHWLFHAGITQCFPNIYHGSSHYLLAFCIGLLPPRLFRKCASSWSPSCRSPGKSEDWWGKLMSTTQEAISCKSPILILLTATHIRCRFIT